MLRSKILSFKTKNIAKKNLSARHTLRYQHVQRVGIIFSVKDQTKHNIIKTLIKQLEADGKKVSVLTYLPRNKENYEFKFDFFTKKDLSFWGNYTSKDVLQFAEQTFDYLLYIDEEPNPLIEGVLAMSKAKCRIGRLTENSSSFFEMMISPKKESDIKSLVDEMYRYIKVLG